MTHSGNNDSLNFKKDIIDVAGKKVSILKNIDYKNANFGSVKELLRAYKTVFQLLKKSYEKNNKLTASSDEVMELLLKLRNDYQELSEQNQFLKSENDKYRDKLGELLNVNEKLDRKNNELKKLNEQSNNSEYIPARMEDYVKNYDAKKSLFSDFVEEMNKIYEKYQILKHENNQLKSKLGYNHSSHSHGNCESLEFYEKKIKSLEETIDKNKCHKKADHCHDHKKHDHKKPDHKKPDHCHDHCHDHCSSHDKSDHCSDHKESDHCDEKLECCEKELKEKDIEIHKLNEYIKKLIFEKKKLVHTIEKLDNKLKQKNKIICILKKKCQKNPCHKKHCKPKKTRVRPITKDKLIAIGDLSVGTVVSTTLVDEIVKVMP